ncbi:thiol:disulfide interchange protein DsbA/DsbL [Pseudoalteromonas denitrificans]|uniref:Thiol:disulfide interchange protein n=1 Tax=Pseudoalteromonas denitrificans DSM 6059 TaxID=1123010 RepID=A0A1I1RAJ1_9GAMM|nr:thiol:disulfide interchange protein DsbA/DsbL [Pseudoalteromonas denitrificans]SFD29178.1 Thiol:disulfide interchange protein DsbA [Pseudoalteromonas denitrificans DSM 6059]
MIKKLKLGLFIMCMPVMAFASQFQNGEQYTELNTDKSAKPEVMEFFSFFCGHCFKMEPVAKGIEKNLPKGVPFIKSHVNFLGGKSAALQSNLSYAYLIAKQQAKEHQVSDAIFNYIHRQRATFSNMKDVSNLLAENGVSTKDFDALLSSMPVILGEKEMVDAQNKYSKMGALTGVPTFIVNGKYKVNVNKLKSQQELDDLITFLLKK